MRRAVITGVLAGALAGCVAEVGPLERRLGRLEVAEGLAFGRVQVGEPHALELRIDNTGPGPVHVSALAWAPAPEGPAHRFEVELEPAWLREGESLRVPVRLVALGDSGPIAARLTVLSDTDDPERPSEKQSASVEVTGEALRWGLAVEPSPADFGDVPSGTLASRTLTLTNLLDHPITAHTPDRLEGRAALAAFDGEGRLEVDAYVGPEGDVPRGRAEIPAGGAITVPARYVAPSVGLGAGGRAQWRVGGCADPRCVQTVTLTAGTENDALVCRPEDVDFGAVYPGEARFALVRCSNLSRTTLTITGARVEPAAAEELGVDPLEVTRLGPGAQVELRVWFRPTEVTLQRGGEVSGSLHVAVRDDASGAEGEARTRLFGRAGGARLRFEPNPLDFGEVALNTERADTLTIENIGFEDATITAIEVDTAGTGAFFADVTPFTVPRGGSVEWQVRFRPTAPGTIASGVRFVTNDAVTPEHAVGLVGIGVDLQPCMYAVEPPEVQFGAVRLGESAVREVTIRNTGPFDCLVRDVRIEPPAGDPTTDFSLEGAPPPATRLTPGQAVSVALRFSPSVAGDARAWLAFYVSDPQDPNPRIPLFAAGASPVEVACPPPVTTPAGQAVDLEVFADSTTQVVRYDWSIISAPSGGIGTPDQWSPDPPRARRERFLPFLVGTYRIQVTVFDALGNSASCSTEVTAEGRGLRVTLTWDGSGDVDLHVHRGGRDAWFSGNDCYYANPRPIWDSSWPQSDGPNPELDFDNTTANGPENTRVNVVQVGETYTIAAHNYARAQGRRATIQIFCGGGTVADATYTSRPLVGMESSNCSSNDFWKVASLVFDSPTTCRIMPIDAYVESRDACSAY